MPQAGKVLSKLDKEGEISRNQFFYTASEGLCWEEQRDKKKDPVSVSIQSKNQSVRVLLSIGETHTPETS